MDLQRGPLARSSTDEDELKASLAEMFPPPVWPTSWPEFERAFRRAHEFTNELGGPTQASQQTGFRLAGT